MASSNENAAIHASTGQVSSSASTRFTTQLYPHTDVGQDIHLPPDDLPAQPLSHSPSKSWSNPRKRPSIPSRLVDSTQNNLTLSEISNGANSYPQKRSRAADWPLRSTDESDAQSVSHRRPCKAPLSPAKGTTASSSPDLPSSSKGA